MTSAEQLLATEKANEFVGIDIPALDSGLMRPRLTIR
jgi:hypothetical protein